MTALREQRRDLPTTSGSTVAGYFRNPSDAETAIERLHQAGFSKNDIGVAIRDQATHAEKHAEKIEPSSTGWIDRLRSKFAPEERDEYDSPDAMDVLDHMGISEDEARYYKDSLLRGGVLLTVHSGTRRAEALSILQSCQAVTGDNFRSQKADARDSDATQNRLELLGETLRINKERVQTGEARIRKDVVSERQQVEVPVTREELVIERRPAQGRETTRTTMEEGKEIRVPLSEERVHVEKQPVVREEVAVGKRQVQDVKTVSEDVRHEELRVDNDVDKRGDVSSEREPRRKRA